MLTFDEFASYIETHTRLEGHPSDHVCIILPYPLFPWNDKHQYLATLTWYTLSKWQYKHQDGNWGGVKNNIIFAKTLDEAMSRAAQYRFALVTFVGSFFRSLTYHTAHSINTYFDAFKQSNQPCKAHIIWRPQQSYPTFHLQTLFVNLDIWREIGKPTFGPYTGVVTLPNRCDTHVHDDYTPIEASPSNKRTFVWRKPFAKYISALMENGYTIHNFSNAERSSKFFTYPDLDEKRNRQWCPPLAEERETYDDCNVIYLNNNERYRPRSQVPLKKPFDVIYTHAGGAVAEYMWREYGHADTKLVIYDAHAPSLEWKRKCYDVATNFDDVKRLAVIVARSRGCKLDEGTYKSELVKDNTITFPHDEWIECFNKIKHVEFIQRDIIQDPPLDIDTTKLTLLYVSNIFAYPPMIHKVSLDTIHERFKYYTQLANTVVYGESVFMDSVLTDNAGVITDTPSASNLLLR